jgi:hypothetical protein
MTQPASTAVIVTDLDSDRASESSASSNGSLVLGASSGSASALGESGAPGAAAVVSAVGAVVHVPLHGAAHARRVRIRRTSTAAARHVIVDGSDHALELITGLPDSLLGTSLTGATSAGAFQYDAAAASGGTAASHSPAGASTVVLASHSGSSRSERARAAASAQPGESSARRASEAAAAPTPAAATEPAAMRDWCEKATVLVFGVFHVAVIFGVALPVATATVGDELATTLWAVAASSSALCVALLAVAVLAPQADPRCCVAAAAASVSGPESLASGARPSRSSGKGTAVVLAERVASSVGAAPPPALSLPPCAELPYVIRDEPATEADAGSRRASSEVTHSATAATTSPVPSAAPADETLSLSTPRWAERVSAAGGAAAAEAVPADVGARSSDASSMPLFLMASTGSSAGGNVAQLDDEGSAPGTAQSTPRLSQQRARPPHSERQSGAPIAVDPATLRTPGAASVAADARSGSARDATRWCGPCGCNVALSSRHCHRCGVCCVGFDHHCPYLGRCIGTRNQLWFAGAVASALLCVALSLTVALFLAVEFSQSRAAFELRVAKAYRVDPGARLAPTTTTLPVTAAPTTTTSGVPTTSPASRAATTTAPVAGPSAASSLDVAVVACAALLLCYVCASAVTLALLATLALFHVALAVADVRTLDFVRWLNLPAAAADDAGASSSGGATGSPIVAAMSRGAARPTEDDPEAAASTPKSSVESSLRLYEESLTPLGASLRGSGSFVAVPLARSGSHSGSFGGRTAGSIARRARSSSAAAAAAAGGAAATAGDAGESPSVSPAASPIASAMPHAASPIAAAIQR